jgi:hypothetical protein
MSDFWSEFYEVTSERSGDALLDALASPLPGVQSLVDRLAAPSLAECECDACRQRLAYWFARS